MLAPPSDFDTGELSEALAVGWGIRDAGLDYLAVGFGSHHWRVTSRDGRRWFLTVDKHRDALSIANLRRAFGIASALRCDAGLPFVVAPIPDTDEHVLRMLGDATFSVALTPWIDAPRLGDGPFETIEQRTLVFAMLGRLHDAHDAIDILPSRENLDLPGITGLRSALDDLDRPWSTGPYGERTRVLLRDGLPGLTTALDRYAELVSRVLTDPAPWVVTHGEPHTANVLRGRDGTVHLIDWDTVRLAPRERDLCSVTDSDGVGLDAYRAIVGEVPVSRAALRLFRMRWDLAEIAEYIDQFHRDHIDDPNTRESWKNLNDYLPVSGDHLGSALIDERGIGEDPIGHGPEAKKSIIC